MDSFLTLGITVKMQAGIISIPAPCFIIVQKEKNLDPLEEKPVYIFSPNWLIHFFRIQYVWGLWICCYILFLSVALSISSNNPVFSSQTYTLTFTLGIKMLHSIIVQIRDNTSIPPYYLIPFEDILYMNNCLL
mgnify:FL=1